VTYFQTHEVHHITSSQQCKYTQNKESNPIKHQQCVKQIVVHKQITREYSLDNDITADEISEGQTALQQMSCSLITKEQVDGHAVTTTTEHAWMATERQQTAEHEALCQSRRRRRRALTGSHHHHRYSVSSNINTTLCLQSPSVNEYE